MEADTVLVCASGSTSIKESQSATSYSANAGNVDLICLSFSSSSA